MSRNLARPLVVAMMLTIAACTTLAQTTAPTTAPAAPAVEPTTAPAPTAAPTTASEAPTTVPVPAVATATAPAAEAFPIVTVAGQTLTTAAVDAQIRSILQSLPPGMPMPDPQQLQQAQGELVQQFVLRHLFRCVVAQKNWPADEQFVQEQLAEIQQAAEQRGLTAEQFMERMQVDPQDLRVQSALMRRIRETTAEERAWQYIQEHPSFFDGTQVRARHILIQSNPFMESTADQLAARQRLEQIAERIRGGEITFEQAVAEHSQDPGSQATGGAYTFPFEQMVTPFALAAFTNEPGTMTIVRTQFGWHLVEPLERIPGDRPVPQPPATQPAAQTAPATDTAPATGTAPSTEPAEPVLTPEQEQALGLAQRTLAEMIQNEVMLATSTGGCEVVWHEMPTPPTPALPPVPPVEPTSAPATPTAPAVEPTTTPAAAPTAPAGQ